jgi:hypothetical protein
VKVRFLADADLNKAILNGVIRRESTVDFLTAQAARLRGMGDPEVLALAAAQHRVLVSHDVGSMPLHFGAFKRSGKRSPGVFLIPQSLDVVPQSTNSSSSGKLRMQRIGKTAWCGCPSERFESSVSIEECKGLTAACSWPH